MDENAFCLIVLFAVFAVPLLCGSAAQSWRRKGKRL